MQFLMFKLFSPSTETSACAKKQSAMKTIHKALFGLDFLAIFETGFQSSDCHFVATAVGSPY